MTVRLSATDWSAPLGWFASDWMSEPTPLYDAVMHRTRPVRTPVLTADEFMAKHASDLLEQPDYQTELNPTPEHTYEAHGADGSTTTFAVVLDEEGER